MEFEVVKEGIVHEQIKLVIEVSPWKGCGLNGVARGLLCFLWSFKRLCANTGA